MQAASGERSLPEGTNLSQLTNNEPSKDLKVRIPVSYHIQLRTLKILKGKSMSDSLAEALDLYFDEANTDLPELEKKATNVEVHEE